MVSVKKCAISAAAVLILAAGPALAGGDVAKGKKVFNKCRACHALEAGKKKLGPSLHGVVGRTARSESYYNYSPAMKAAGVQWT